MKPQVDSFLYQKFSSIKRRNFLKFGLLSCSNFFLDPIPILSSPINRRRTEIKMLNLLLNFEFNKIAAYTLSLQSGILHQSKSDIIKSFLEQHQGHRDILTRQLKYLGAEPVSMKKPFEYENLKAIFPRLKLESDIFRFALLLEEEAATGYLTVVSRFSESDFIQVIAEIAADEAQHAAIMRVCLGERPNSNPLVS